VISTLKAAFVAGMLGKDEFDLRVGQAFASRTCAELAAVTADLPAGLTAARPPQSARVRGKARVARNVAVLTAATALYAAIWPLALSIHRNMEGNPIPYDGKLILTSTLAYLFIAVMAVKGMRNSGRSKRSGGQPPRRPVPGAGGQASQDLPSADPGRKLPPADPGHRHTADAAPIGRPRLVPS